MRRGLSVLFVVFVILIVNVSSVLASPAQAARAATLQRVTYERSGITLVFHSSGLSRSDLQKTSFAAHSRQWNMACSFGSDTTVRCRVSKQLSRFAGESFHGTLAGFQFSGTLPRARKFPVVQAPGTLTETFSACPAGQTLWYTFEYSDTSYQAEVWSEDYIDSNTFYAAYGVYPESASTYMDGTDIYYIYTYTTSTSGYGATTSDNWDALAAAYEADGFAVVQTGERCDFHL